MWDNASWHVSKAVRAWVRAHNLRAKKGGGCRLVVCRLPVKAPWLHPIEPKWVHGKRATAEPTRALEPDELRQRLCDYYACDLLPLLSQEAA